MATVEIPINGDLEAQKMTVELDGKRYRLSFYFQFRQESWYMDIKSFQDVPILVGLKLVPDFPLIGRYAIEGLPPGEFEAVDTSGQGEPAGRDDFGLDRRVKLYYTEAE